MTRRALLTLSVLTLAACSADDAVVTAPGPRLARTAPSADVTRHLVVFKGDRVPAWFAARARALGGTVDLTLAPVGAATVTGLSDAAAAELRGRAGVQAVEEDVMLAIDATLGATAEGEGDLGGASVANPSAAFAFPFQWHLAQIGAPAAWAAGKRGAPSVRVGVIDTGIDYTHPDLLGKVDLVASRSFLPKEDAVVDSLYPGAHPVADLFVHGTHVAATISSNAFIAAGVTSQTTLVGLKACFGFGENQMLCPGAALASAVMYGVDIGLPILNLSLGGGFDRSEHAGLVSIYNSIVHYASTRGTTLVVAAGNDTTDLDHAKNYYAVLCDAPNVICVAATGPTAATEVAPTLHVQLENPDAPAPYSNSGRSAISVAAPGGAAAFVLGACSRFYTVAIPGGFVRPCFSPLGSTIAGLSGTSMAAPHVSGLAALLVADGVTHPAQIRARIERGADDLGEPGTDPHFGKGRINVPATLGLN